MKLHYRVKNKLQRKHYLMKLGYKIKYKQCLIGLNPSLETKNCSMKPIYIIKKKRRKRVLLNKV